MTTNPVNRIDKIEALLEKSIQATIADRQAHSLQMGKVKAVLSADSAGQSNHSKSAYLPLFAIKF